MYLKEKLRLLLIAVATLFLVGGSFFVMNFVNRTAEERKARDLNKTLDLIEDGIKDKLITAEELVYSLRGLVLTEGINSQKWLDYVDNAEIDSRYPGIYSLAYAERVPKENLTSYEENLKRSESEKYLDYLVFPKTNSSEFFPVKYLYTTNSELNSMLGFDFQYSEKSIRTFQNALEMDMPALSEPLHLDLVVPNSKEVGYIIVLPVYENSEIVKQSIEEKKEALKRFCGNMDLSEKLRS